MVKVLRHLARVGTVHWLVERQPFLLKLAFVKLLHSYLVSSLLVLHSVTQLEKDPSCFKGWIAVQPGRVTWMYGES